MYSFADIQVITIANEISSRRKLASSRERKVHVLNGELLLSEQSALSDIFPEIQSQKSITFFFLSSSLFRGLSFVRRGQRRLHHEGRDVQYSRRNISDGGKCIPFNVLGPRGNLRHSTARFSDFVVSLYYPLHFCNLLEITQTYFQTITNS